MFKVPTSKPKTYFLLPVFAASNWYYTYIFHNFNGYDKFNSRTRSLNSLLYWAMQMFGAILICLAFYWQHFRRSVRVKFCWAFIFMLGISIWGGSIEYQLKEDRESDIAAMDFTDKGYIGPLFLYMFYGMYDAMFQSYILYILSYMSNKSKKSILYAFFYKCFQSALANIISALDSKKVSYMSWFGGSRGLVVGSLLVVAPLFFFDIVNHADIQKDDVSIITDKSESDVVSYVQQTKITPKDV